MMKEKDIQKALETPHPVLSAILNGENTEHQEAVIVYARRWLHKLEVQKDPGKRYPWEIDNGKDYED